MNKARLLYYAAVGLVFAWTVTFALWWAVTFALRFGWQLQVWLRKVGMM